MLELRPNCECCDKDLPLAATDAMICTYECTFCADCVEKVLSNVCPNCGGGFVPRPIRPAIERRKGLSISHQPPSKKRVRTNYNQTDLRALAEPLKSIKPEER